MECCSDYTNILSGFKINRSLEQTLKICEKDLHLEQNRSTGDYEVRIGVTQDRVATQFSIQNSSLFQAFFKLFFNFSSFFLLEGFSLPQQREVSIFYHV